LPFGGRVLKPPLERGERASGVRQGLESSRLEECLWQSKRCDARVSEIVLRKVLDLTSYYILFIGHGCIPAT
jgi:hypothetical protein